MNKPTQIIAKFRCFESHSHDAGVNRKTQKVKLTAVHEENGVNKAWSEATPSGSLEMQINNAAAQDLIEPGKSYLITIMEAMEAAG